MHEPRRTAAVLAALAVILSATAPAVGAAAAADPAGDQRAGAVPHALAAQSQADCGFPYTATDAGGTEVTIEQRPERVTTLNPSAAQTMWEIGGKSQVVGVSRFASYLEGADSRANVSAAGFGVSVEKVVGTNPDLVLAPSSISAETVTSLRDAGLTVFHLPEATNVSDVSRKTTLIGRLTGNCEGAAAANAWMEANVEAARNATADAEDRRVLYPLGGGYIAGTNTFIDAMIQVAGGANVAAERNLTGYPQINDEVVVELAPEYLIVTNHSEYLLEQEPYASTPAVENDNVVSVDTNWMNQPAPRSVVYGVRNLTRGLHPDAAESVEFVSREEAVQGTANATTGTNTTDATNTTEATNTTGAAATSTGTAAAETTAAGTAAAGTTAAGTAATTTGGGTATSTPGFGVALAVLALVGSGLLARRER